MSPVPDSMDKSDGRIFYYLSKITGMAIRQKFDDLKMRISDMLIVKVQDSGMGIDLGTLFFSSKATL